MDVGGPVSEVTSAANSSRVMKIVRTAFTIAIAAAVMIMLTSSMRPVKAGPFDQGRWRLSFGGGTTSSFDNRYFVLGVGIVFYKHWFIGSDYVDVDTIGGQVGVMYVAGRGFFVGGGVAHEVIISECDQDCSDTYPEIHFSISF